MNDIDCGKRALPKKDFSGTLDGNGHRISNTSNTTRWLISTNNGTVKNLIFGKAGETVEYCPTSASEINSLIYKNTGTIENVTNYRSVISTANSNTYSTANEYTGLIVGTNTGIVKHCTNYGHITIGGNATFSTKYFSFAGIVGVNGTDDVSGQIISCSNFGDITISSTSNTTYTSFAKNSYIGGIVGQCKNTASKIDGCRNNGNITIGACITTTFRVGGIAGLINAGDCTDNTNMGDITVDGLSSALSTVKTGSIAWGQITGKYGGSGDTQGNAGSGTMSGKNFKNAQNECTDCLSSEPISYINLAGKKVCVLGNSFVYYGSFVKKGSQRSTDKGLFYQMCKAKGQECTVYDCCYGSHSLDDYTAAGCDESDSSIGDHLAGVPLDDIDVVFMSESGSDNNNFITDVKNLMDRFTKKDVRFYYLCHSYTYDKSHNTILGNLSVLRSMGFVIVPWGHLVYDVWKGNKAVPGATQSYNKNSFIVNKKDTYHPNPLSGYITAVMAFCAATGQSAVGQPYSFVEANTKEGSFDSFISSYYSDASDTNLKAIFSSQADMSGLQTLVDQYIKLGK